MAGSMVLPVVPPTSTIWCAAAPVARCYLARAPDVRLLLWPLYNGPPAERRAIRARCLGDLVAANLKYGNTDRAATHQAALDALQRKRRAEGEIE